MSRKDYIRIAAALAESRPAAHMAEHIAVHAQWQWTKTRDALVTMLAADNGRFDRERFIRATEAHT